ncbi:redoxin domain-containing protein [Sporosarcina sp. FSL K6-1522]|uniref:peroxiredoxin family protein n=1 Tax=Sporosarcina sp. FSL K6-1522 TaxID=2921554 RepID=UPI00315A6A82
MNKKIMGSIIAILLIGSMVVIMLKDNLGEPEPIDDYLAGADLSALEDEPGLQRGDTPPDFELTTIAGETVKLSDLQGKKVVLNFWASWCGPCKAEMPHMEKFYKKHKDEENVEIIAVNLLSVEKQGMQGVEQFIDAYGLTFPIPLDEDGAIMDAYQVMTIPTTFMLGTDGTIVHKIVGPMDEKMMKDLVSNLP